MHITSLSNPFSHSSPLSFPFPKFRETSSYMQGFGLGEGYMGERICLTYPADDIRNDIKKCERFFLIADERRSQKKTTVKNRVKGASQNLSGG